LPPFKSPFQPAFAFLTGMLPPLLW
jgi:hypothetical protein